MNAVRAGMTQPWPAVSHWARALAEITLLREPAEAPRAVEGRPINTWTRADGAPLATFYRITDGYLVRFHECADFEIEHGGRRVRCRPVPGAAEAGVEHLYRHQVVPLALGWAGMPVFHASAVSAAEGAIVLVGMSGRGKSTLAASFASRGFAFLADDGLVLAQREGSLHAMPSEPSVRLWPDSYSAVVLAGGTAHAHGKVSIQAGESLQHEARPVRVRCVYFLGPGAERIAIASLTPRDALIGLVRHSFLLDVAAADILALHFEQLSRTVNEVRCASLDYPRRYEALGDVRDAILADMRAE
jgi:hypothetical protein